MICRMGVVAVRALLLFVVMVGVRAFAQGATVGGEIVDPSGGPVVTAVVKLTESASGAVQRATVNEAGIYSLRGVKLGNYTLTIAATGFARYEQAVVAVTAGQRITLNARLRLEATGDSVTVRGDAVSLQEVPTVGKTGTMLEDLPTSVQIIGRELVDSQGGLNLKDAIRNSSGVSQGGGNGFGFNDQFVIRGLQAQIYNDGFSDGDQRNGIPHSVNGVERVEVMEGPGSSLFGSGPPGGVINIVHYAPSNVPLYGGGFQTGSFGLYSGNAFATGATGIQGLNYRVDGLAQHEAGFRALTSADYELKPELSWAVGQHLVFFSADGRELQAVPDPAGLIYVNGTPIASVSRNTKYSSPFGVGDQSLARTIASDIWTAKPYLTMTTRFSYMYRNLSILRNGDGGTVTGIVFSGRQLRKQHDLLNDFDFESEPVWTFKTGSVKHTLLTGFEAQHQKVADNRATADLPNITNIFDPVVPETSVRGLTFLQNATHSGFFDDLTATYLGMYATDQIDVTSKLKVRLSARQDVWDTQLAPQVFVPGRILTGTTLIEPPNVYTRDDHPVSWSAGAVYRVLPGVSPFVGVARSNLVNFTSEATQNGVQAPESGIQYEAGLKVAALRNRVMLTAAGFDVKRNNVFTLVGDVPVFNDQQTDGGEANVQVLLGRWNITANGTGQHAWLTDNPSSPAATGKRPVGVPQNIFNLWTTYDLGRGRLKGVKVSGGLTHRDKEFGDVLNTKSIPVYTTVDAVVSYAGRGWNSELGLRNLADTRYFTAANGAGGFVGEPRSVFFAVKRVFGTRK